MEKRDTLTDSQRAPFSGIWAVGLLLVIPALGGGVWYQLSPERTRPGARVKPAALSAAEEAARTDTTKMTSAPADEKERTRPGPALKVPSTRPRVAEPMHGPEPDELSEAAQKDAERISRFDENAATFDHRLEVFARERGSLDEEAGSVLKERLEPVLRQLHEGIEVEVECAESVCIASLSSVDPVGTMIARIAPWLRRNTSAATGDPNGVDDERGMRLAFDKADALAVSND